MPPHQHAIRDKGMRESTSHIGESSGPDSAACGPVAERPLGRYAGDTALARPMVTLELEAHCIWNSGEPVFLRPRERRLLGLLLQNPNSIIELETIIAALYGEVPIEKGRIRLRRLVADIRRRAGPEFCKRLRTIPRVGLMLVAESNDKSSRLRRRSDSFGDADAAILDDCAAHQPMVAEPAQFKP